MNNFVTSVIFACLCQTDQFKLKPLFMCCFNIHQIAFLLEENITFFCIFFLGLYKFAPGSNSRKKFFSSQKQKSLQLDLVKDNKKMSRTFWFIKNSKMSEFKKRSYMSNFIHKRTEEFFFFFWLLLSYSSSSNSINNNNNKSLNC